MVKDKIFQIEVQSETSSNKWKVTEYDDGSWACSCPKWIFRRGEKQNCKHIDKIICERKIEATINIGGLNEQQVGVERNSTGNPNSLNPPNLLEVSDER
jgi:hypothetical protein